MASIITSLFKLESTYSYSFLIVIIALSLFIVTQNKMNLISIANQAMTQVIIKIIILIILVTKVIKITNKTPPLLNEVITITNRKFYSVMYN